MRSPVHLRKSQEAISSHFLKVAEIRNLNPHFVACVAEAWWYNVLVISILTRS